MSGLEVTMMKRIGELNAEVKYLQDKVERLTAEVSYDKRVQLHVDKLAAEFTQCEVERLKAEVERLRKAGEWQPIETAPKDGTWFIAGFDGDLPSRHAWAAMCIWECGRFEVQETPDQPDYWMPLPKPPQEDRPNE